MVAPATAAATERCGLVTNGQRDQRRPGERRAGEIALARPALPLFGQIADQRRDRQVVRPSERRDREGERGQQSKRHPKRDDARLDRRRKRNRQQRAEQPVDGERDRRAERRASERADQRDDRGIRRARAPRRSLPVAPIAFRIASVARLRSTKPCAALATPTPPTTSDSSPASVRNSAKRSRSRLKSGETLSRERASQPACGKARLALAE